MPATFQILCRRPWGCSYLQRGGNFPTEAAALSALPKIQAAEDPRDAFGQPVTVKWKVVRVEVIAGLGSSIQVLHKF